MNVRNLIVLATAAALPFSVVAQTSAADKPHDKTLKKLNRVSKDAVDVRLTAKDLIGKDIHDSRGKKIGAVNDIVLNSDQTNELAVALAEPDRRDRTAATTTDRTASGSMARAADKARSTLTGRMSEPGVIISFGSVMGMGGDLLHVPLSLLTYDAAEKRLVLNATEQEIASLPKGTDWNEGVAE
jgi:sporulation protein YlmC with PRC-barrel domain